jgi:NAD(P)-dependent dehydrogenase (short-subunit alcohol dehydrogenase family)
MSTKQGALVVGVGASEGLGGALVRRFAREGLTVFAAGRAKEKLEATVAEVRKSGGDVHALVGDASTETGVKEFFDAAERTAPLALVVHNAGGNRASSILDMELSMFEGLWREHALGGFLVGREAARRLVPRGKGTIVFTGASASLRGKANFAAFASAKFSVRALSQSMARELGPKGIHVGHVIIDGGIEGARLLGFFPDLKEQRGPDGLLNIDAIAEAYWQIHTQHRSAWTQELDLRPYKEAF